MEVFIAEDDSTPSVLLEHKLFQIYNKYSNFSTAILPMKGISSVQVYKKTQIFSET